MFSNNTNKIQPERQQDSEKKVDTTEKKQKKNRNNSQPQKQHTRLKLNGKMMNLLSLKYMLWTSHHGAHKYNRILNLPTKWTDEKKY